MPAPLIIAHRGASGHRPELTRSALLLAVEQGADAVEVDVVASADGVLVVRHDPELSETTDVEEHAELRPLRRAKVVRGRPRVGWFAEDLRLEQLQALGARERLPRLRPESAAHDGEPLLTLGDAMDLLAGTGVRLVVELKHVERSARLGLPVDEILLDLLAGPGRRPELAIESFEHHVLDRLAERGVGCPLVALIGHSPVADLRTVRDPAPFARYDGVSLRAGLVRPAVVDGFRGLGLDVWTWTLRPENRFLPPRFRTPTGRRGRYGAYWRRLVSAGVTGVFADHPDLALEELGRPADVGVPAYP